MAEKAPPDLSAVEFALHLREYHHTGLWEEQKHFTWLISLILSAELLALSSDSLSHGMRDAIVLLASLVGLAMSHIAIRIQHKEGSYFTHANKLFVQEFNEAFPGPLELRSVEDSHSRVRTFLRAVRGTGGVRDHFELLFLIFWTAFLALAVLAAVRLLR